MAIGSANTTQPNAPPSSGRRPQLALHVVSPEGVASRPLPLCELGTLGRAGEGPNRIDHHTVSRTHAEIRPAQAGYLMRDLGSKNGTFVNGVPLRTATLLLPQMVVRFGDVFFVVDDQTRAPFLDLPDLPGTAASIAMLRERLRIAAGERTPVLISGETGTGKERLAAAVHQQSGLPGPYVTFNCAELSPQLAESQLFGHERGAFTGAVARKEGLFTAAHGGTLFLDELGELPLDLQAKLLRVLETGEVRPLGAVHDTRVDVRIVAATNRPLEAAVTQGTFRRDLRARLAVWELQLPPLRRRRQDILPWIEHLVAIWSAERGHPTTLTFSPRAVAAILQHDWSDNLRGLKRLLHRLLPLRDRPTEPVGETLLYEALPELAEALHAAHSNTDGAGPEAAGTSTRPPAAEILEPGERPSREELLDVYLQSQRSVRATAKHFGKDRRQIYRWLTSYGIER